MNILNLYAGVGGNRKHWEGDITAVEWDEDIAETYSELYPEDKVICGDAHEYLLLNFHKFDFIWSSPPCQSHSKMIRSGRNRKPRYPDLRLYEEILLLKTDFKGKWVVENVVPYYSPLVAPSAKVGRHLFWCNFDFGLIQDPVPPENFINTTNLKGKAILQEWLGIHYERNLYYGNNHCPAQVLRNCVHPDIGKQIMEFVIEST